MRTFNFEITFICNNTNQEKTITKQYKGVNYIQAKNGIKEYCNTNKTFKSLLSLRCIKFNSKSVNLLKHKD